jgi:hypothetical protein
MHQDLYRRHQAKRLHQYQDLHCIKPNYIDLNIRHQAVRLHRAMNKIFVESYIANKIIAKVYIHVVFHRHRQKPCRRRDLRLPPPTIRPAAAVIFDRRCRLRQDPPPP